MNTHSLCCIGYITQDKVVTPKIHIYAGRHLLLLRTCHQALEC